MVVDAGTEGQEVRENRPQYYKIPGQKVDRVVIQVPEGRTSTIYLLAVPTPPFELEDVPGFVDGYSLTWPYKYRVKRLTSLPEGAEIQSPIVLNDDEMLELESIVVEVSQKFKQVLEAAATFGGETVIEL